jgi:hypothetical protein
MLYYVSACRRMHIICIQIHIYNYVIYHKISLTGLTYPSLSIPHAPTLQEDNECKKQQEKSSVLLHTVHYCSWI